MEKFVDYYKLLNIRRNATESEIRRAYFEALKRYRPDKINDSQNSQIITNSKFLLICKAEETLSNPTLRRAYNKKYDEHQRKLSFTNAYSDDSKKVAPTEDYSSVWQKAPKPVNEESAPKSDLQSTTTRPQTTKKSTAPEKATSSRTIDETKLREHSNKRSSKKSQKSAKRGKLSISKKFIRELSKLKVRPHDNCIRYVLRNRNNLLAGSLAAAIIIGGIAISNNDDKIVIDTLPAITSEYESDSIQAETTAIVEETTQPTELSGVITLYRVHRIVTGDILSQFSIDSNTTQEEIKRVNGMNSNTVVLGTDLIIPYIIDAEDLDLYTQSAAYTPGMSLEEYAKEYETNAETIAKLNPEAVTYDGTRYEVVTDSLLVPDFITKSDYEVLKAAERIKQKNNNN